jgi:hypothetical protein
MGRMLGSFTYQTGTNDTVDCISGSFDSLIQEVIGFLALSGI